MTHDRDLELLRFLAAVKDLSELYSELLGLYDHEKSYHADTNNPAIPLAMALSHSRGTIRIRGENFEDEMIRLDNYFGKPNSFFYELVERIRERFSLLERAVLENMKWDDVKRIGRVSQHLEYLYRVPTSEEIMRRFVQYAFNDKSL